MTGTLLTLAMLGCQGGANVVVCGTAALPVTQAPWRVAEAYLIARDRKRNPDPLRHFSNWLSGQIPDLTEPDSPPPKTPYRWSPEALKLAELISVREFFHGLKGGVSIEQRNESYGRFPKKVKHIREKRLLISQYGWYTSQRGSQERLVISWANRQSRGWLQPGYQLGTSRPAVAADRRLPKFNFSLGTWRLLSQRHAGSRLATVEPAGANRKTLIIKDIESSHFEHRFLIDTDRRVLLKEELFQNGRKQSTYRFSDFVFVAGRWWPRTWESIGKEGFCWFRTTQRVQRHSLAEITKRMRQKLSVRTRSILLGPSLPAVTDAQRSVDAGRDRLADRLALLKFHADAQRWDKAIVHLTQAERLAPESMGLAWLRVFALHAASRRPELKQAVLALLSRVLKSMDTIDFSTRGAIARMLPWWAGNAFEKDPEGLLKFHERLAPLVEGIPEPNLELRHYRDGRIRYLRKAGFAGKALALLKTMAEASPLDDHLQRDYSKELFKLGRRQEALDWINRSLARIKTWPTNKKEYMWSAKSDFLKGMGRDKEWRAHMEGCLKQHPSDRLYFDYLMTFDDSDRRAEAEKIARQWLRDALKHAKPDASTLIRINVAVWHSTYFIGHERNFDLLAETVRTLARNKAQDGTGIVSGIMFRYSFYRTKAAHQLRKEFAELLIAEADGMSPDAIWLFIGCVHIDEPAADRKTWRRIVDAVERRWTKDKYPGTRDAIGRILRVVCGARISRNDLLRFMRREVQEGPAESRDDALHRYFEALLAMPPRKNFLDSLDELPEKPRSRRFGF